MAYSAPPARTEISDTYPNPSNAVARAGFGKLWDYVTGLLGSTGSPTAAKAALLVPQDVDFTNRIINGAMVIDQRNAGASVTPTTDGQYTLDRWKVQISAASKFSVQQNAGSVTPPTGFSKYFGVTSLSAYSVSASDYFVITQQIEGFNTADLNWGSASAKTVTVSAWVYSSLTGTFGGSIQNASGNRSYPFTYSIPVANTWTQISIPIAGDTTGTWIGATNGIGLALNFNLGTGTTYSGTAGAWAAGNYASATGATSVIGTSGATFYITGVQLEKGTAATGFAYRPYGTELALCQRYYYRNDATSNGALFSYGFAQNTTNTNHIQQPFVSMRAAPTVGFSSVSVSTPGGTLTAISDISSASLANILRLTTTTTGMVAGAPYFIRATSTGFIDFSAEL